MPTTFRYEILSVCAVAGLLGLVRVVRPESLRSFISSRRYNQEPVFSLLVTLQFTSQVYKDKFLQDIAPVAKYVRYHEPDTLAYEVLLSDKDPLQVLILERYKNKRDAYLQLHKSSEAFLEFRPKLQALQESGHVRISGHSYLDSNVGFGDRTSYMI